MVRVQKHYQTLNSIKSTKKLSYPKNAKIKPPKMLRVQKHYQTPKVLKVQRKLYSRKCLQYKEYHTLKSAKILKTLSSKTNL